MRAEHRNGDSGTLAAPGRARRGRDGGAVASGADARTEVVRESLEQQARSTHEEARMVLPGIQALFGFQLIAVFNRPFFELGSADRLLHLVALVLVALAIGLIMAPAAHHRLAHPTVVSQAWIRHAAHDIAWAMAALMLAIGVDVYLVAVMIVDDRTLAATLGAGAWGLLGWLWFGRPWVARRRGGNDDRAAVPTSTSVTVAGGRLHGEGSTGRSRR